jgi:phage baseplate assembly protein W
MSSLQGISVRLPLAYSKEDGPYGLNKNIGQVVKQNFKNLVLTSPGERPMVPDFGCGLRRLLFEPINGPVRQQVITAINKQVNSYMPFINIEKISFITSEEDQDMGINEARISIKYNLGSIDSSDTLEISPIND